MKVQVTINNVKIIEPNILNENEYNIHECEFEFVEEYNGLSKKAIFTNEAGADYIVSIVGDKCSIPSEVLKEKEFVKLGVYAYDVENEELVLRYSPRPTEFYVQEGSYKNAGGTPPTPSEIEQLQAQITHNRNDIEDIQDNIVEINEQQEIQDETIQNNTEAIGTINENIGDLQEEQVVQNRNIQANADDIGEINQDINAINEDIDNLKQDLTNYSLITETGSQINLNVNSTNYQITAILKDKNGNVIYTSNAIDLPIESMIVNARYDNATKEIVLTLQNGNTLRISVADLVSGLVSETQLQTILANYYNKTEVDNLLSNLTGRVLTNEEDIADIKEEQTTQNTNIEELQNQVETLQEDLESANSEIEELNTDITNMAKAMYKVDGQGSDITLPNTSENKFVEFGLEGRTEQEQLTGKNLFNISNVTFDLPGSSVIDSNIIKNTMGLYNQQIKVITSRIFTAGTYTISGKVYIGDVNPEKRYVVGFYGNYKYKVVQSYNSWEEFSVTITIDANKDGLVFQGIGNATNSLNLNTQFKDIQVEEGSTATSYEPYCGGIPSPNPDFPQQIKNVTGNANVKIQNKNLFSVDEFITEARAKGYTSSQVEKTTYLNKEVLKYQNSLIDLRFMQGKFKENTQYVFQTAVAKSGYNGGSAPFISIHYTDDTNTNIYVDYSSSSFITKTTISTENKTIDYINVRDYSLSQYVYLDLSVTQLEQGSTATSYVPHQEQNYPFTFAEGQRGMQGTTLEDDGIHNIRKQRVLDGTEFWNVSSRSNGYQFVTVNTLGKRGDNSKVEILSNYFKGIKFNDRDTQSESIYSYVDDNDIRILTNVATNVNDFKQWLSTHNITVEFILAEEEIIPYNSTQQAQYNNIKANATSYDDITYISSESDELGFDMNVVAVADANKVIDSELQEIKNAITVLGGELNV